MSILTVQIPAVVRDAMVTRYSNRNPNHMITTKLDFVSLKASLEAAVDIGDGMVEVNIENGKAVNAFWGTTGLFDTTLATPAMGNDPGWLLAAYRAVAAVAGVSSKKTVQLYEGQQLVVGSTQTTAQPKLGGKSLKEIGTILGKTAAQNRLTWRYTDALTSKREDFVSFVHGLIDSAPETDHILLTNTGCMALGILEMK
jgi:hypothetical protein